MASLAAIGLGALVVKIGADTAGLVSGVTGAQNSMKRLEAAAFGLSKIISGSVVAAAGALTLLTKSSLSTLDEQSKLAKRLDGTVAALQGLVHAGDLAGISAEMMTKSMTMLNTRLAEAARTAKGPAYEGLRRVGLSAKDLLALDVDERLAVMADRFNKLGLSSAQQAEILQDLGVRAKEMINLFDGGGDAIRAAAKDTKAFNVAVSDVDAKTIEAANDAWTTAQNLLTSIGNNIAVNIAPAMKSIGDDFAEAGRQSQGFSDAIDKAIRNMLAIVAFVDTEFQRVREGFADTQREIISIANVAIRAYNAIALPFGVISKPIEEFKEEYVKTRDELGKTPSREDWYAWWDGLIARGKQYNFTLKEIQDAVYGTKPPPKLDPLTAEERKALNEKFLAFQKELASEAAALDFHRQEQIVKLREFNEKQIGTQLERNNASLAIEAEYQRKRNEFVWANLESQIATENEILARRYADQLRMLTDAETAQTITHQEALRLRAKMDERYAIDNAKLVASQYSNLAGIVDTAMGNISQIIGKEGGAAFEIMKAISMATATVKGIEAVVSAYAAGSAIGGPPVGAAFAAIAAAGVAAQIAKLAMTRPGGAGGGATASSGFSGGSSTAAAEAAAPAAPSRTLVVEGLTAGAFVSGEVVRELMKEVAQFQRDGGEVLVR